MIVRGPSVYVVPGSDGLACPVAAAAGSPTSSAALTFRFPRAVFLTGMMVLARASGAFASYQAQLAQLSLAVVDETNQPIASDTRGSLLGSNGVPVALPLLAMQGRGLRPLALQRPLAASDQWVFTVQNADPVNAQTLAGILLYVSDPA